MTTIDLRYITRGGRCAWCWEALGETESHTAVSAKVAPPLELHFHHACWPVYEAASGLDRKRGEPWTPQRVEELRIRGGYNTAEFARRLKCNPERLRRVGQGDLTALSPTLLRELKSLAAELKFEKRGGIDWSDPRAFFCLCRHLGWAILDAHRNLGCAQSTAKSWLDNGVPRSTPNTWMRLDRVAAKNGFDGAMVVDDRCWTAGLLEAAIDRAGVPVSRWAALAGLTEVSVRNYQAGRGPITRNAAWGLTRAAVALGVELPPVGRVPYARPPQERYRPRGRKRKWTAEMNALLGTAVDAEVGRRIGKQPMAVAKQRKRLGIPAFQGKEKEGVKRMAEKRVLTADEIVLAIKGLNEEQKAGVLEQFCRVCHEFLGPEKDWGGRNYCAQCSPDPRE